MQKITKSCLRLEKYANRIGLLGRVRKYTVAQSGANKGPTEHFRLSDGKSFLELGRSRASAIVALKKSA